MAVQYSKIQKLLRSRADLNAREAHEIRKTLRSIEKQLAAAGYSEDDLSADVINNIAVARANMKMNIYDQAVLEGVATSFHQTEEDIENGKLSGMTATDAQKILNLKHTSIAYGGLYENNENRNSKLQVDKRTA